MYKYVCMLGYTMREYWQRCPVPFKYTTAILSMYCTLSWFKVLFMDALFSLVPPRHTNYRKNVPPQKTQKCSASDCETLHLRYRQKHTCVNMWRPYMHTNAALIKNEIHRWFDHCIHPIGKMWHLQVVDLCKLHMYTLLPECAIMYHVYKLHWVLCTSCIVHWLWGSRVVNSQTNMTCVKCYWFLFVENTVCLHQKLCGSEQSWSKKKELVLSTHT